MTNERLKFLQSQLGITNADLSLLTGVHPVQVSKIRAGIHPVPRSFETIIMSIADPNYIQKVLETKELA